MRRLCALGFLSLPGFACSPPQPREVPRSVAERPQLASTAAPARLQHPKPTPATARLAPSNSTPATARLAPSHSRQGKLSRDELALAVTAHGDLMLRATRSDYARVLATEARQVLYDPALELVWFSDGERLSVLDVRGVPKTHYPPVVIAKDLPAHVEIHVAHAGRHVEPDDACDRAPALTLHWEAEPWIEGGDGQRVTRLEGRDWLVREAGRAPREPSEEHWFHPANPHIPLPTGSTRCEEPSWCGASLTLDRTASGSVMLVLAAQNHGADCWHTRCLLYDSSTKAFATPPDPQRWSRAGDVALGSCGPYRFDRVGRTFLLEDQVCVLDAGCRPLGGTAVGWLTPGPTVGSP